MSGLTGQRTMRASAADWLCLGALVVLWGSSYALIEIGLRVFPAMQIAALRTITGAIVLLLALGVTGQRPRGGRRFWLPAFAVAVLGNCVPFFLIPWAQVRIESGLAGIIVATTPLFVLVLSHYVLHDERLERRQFGAFSLAFAGVVVLMGAESLAGLGGDWSRVLAQLAVLVAAFCYASATVLARFIPGGQPVATAAAVMTLAAGLMSVVTVPDLVQTGAVPLRTLPAAILLAVGALGVFGTGLASILYFRVVQTAGARFTSLLNFLVPAWAVALGWVLLGETLQPSAWVALALILGGVLLTQPRR